MTSTMHEAVLTAVFEHAHDAVVITDAAVRVVGWNAAAEDLYGIPAAEAMGQIVYELATTDYGVHVDFTSIFDAVVADGRWRGQLRQQRRDGWWIDVETTVAVVPPEAGGGSVTIVRDMTAQKAIERQLAWEAAHDPLTSALNRRAILALVAVADTRDVVAYIDLNDFKAINDRHGHAVGDAVLALVAARLRGAVRGVDDVGRLGGDEFAVLVRECSGVPLSVIEDHLARVLGYPFSVDGVPIRCTAAVGASRLTNTSSAVADADRRMYRAKPRRSGGSRAAAGRS